MIIRTNKTVSRDTKIKTYTVFQVLFMAKYGTKDGALFEPLAITRADATPPSLHFVKKSKIDKVAHAFYKMV